MIRYTFVLLTLIASHCIYSQHITITGTVSDESNTPLPYSTVLIKDNNIGTSTNSEGKFILKLPQGKYHLEARFIGYSSKTFEYNWNSDTSITLTLAPNTYTLDEIELQNDKTDLAKSIMRKAQARAKYHKWIYRGYQSRFYIKATAIIRDIPFLLSPMINSLKIEENVPFTSETISEIHFSQPNNYKEKIISYNGTTDKDKVNPGRLIKGSFYNDKIYEVTSPLSPNANLVYTYDLIGTFYEDGVEINKIKVIPRLDKEKVFSGEIYIRSNTWDIHSLELSTVFLGNTIKVSQTFAPTEYDVFLPQTTTIKSKVDFWGVEGDVEYLSSSQGYDLELNPDFLAFFNQQNEKNNIQQEAIHVITKSLDTLDNSSISKQLEEYETKSLIRLNMEHVERTYEFQVDSNLMITDIDYWNNLRPVPLTKEEEIGLRKLDTAIMARDMRQRSNSISGLFQGNHYVYSPTSEMDIDYALGLNMISGYQALMQFEWMTAEQKGHYDHHPFDFTFKQTYHHAWNNWTADMSFTKYFNKTHLIGFKIGRILTDINPYQPESFLQKFRIAYMFTVNDTKFKQEDFVEMNYMWFNQRKSRWSIQWAGGIYDRQLPVYHVDQQYMSYTRPEFLNFTSKDDLDQQNIPNTRLFHGTLGHETSFIQSIGVTYRPFLKFEIKNGITSPVRLETTPKFSLTYQTGIPHIANSTANFGRLDLKVNFDLNLDSWFDTFHVFRSGFTVYNEYMNFYDYTHHFGNQRIFINRNNFYEQFLNMGIYDNSTDDYYITYNGNITFDHLFLTALDIFPPSFNTKERITLNTLYDYRDDNHYTEIGYALDGLFGNITVGVYHTLSRDSDFYNSSRTKLILAFNRTFGF